MFKNLKNSRNLILLIFFFNIVQYQAQKQATENLYYFSDADSTKVGVRTESGKIIIPLRGSSYRGYDFKNPIRVEYLEFLGTDKNQKFKKDSPLNSAGEVYDREGNFLYYPQLFDSGNDYFEEGFRRYVDGNKMGFVNRSGQKIIPAQWDFAEPFNYGYATVYTGGWKKQHEKSGEHWTIVPISKKSSSFLINKKGLKVNPSAAKTSERDYVKDGKYYPDPFVYNEFEKKIVDQLNAMPILSEINIATCSNCTPKSNWILNFEITEYPTSFNPFYTLQGFINQRSDDDIKFVVSKDGQKIFHESWLGEKILLEDWIKFKKAEIKEYFEDHPERVNTFEIK